MKLLLMMCVVMVTHGFGAAECPETYAEYEQSGRCFYSHTVKLNFADASSYCWAKGQGYVTRLKTFEDEIMASSFQANPLDIIWNGLKDTDADGVFQFTDLTPINFYESWNPIPSGDPTKTCAIRKDLGAAAYQWAAASCDDLNFFVCEAAQISPPCDAHWTHNPDANTCVRAIRGRRRTYNQASAYCFDNFGGELATSVTTLTERKRLMKLMKFQGHFFIGVDDNDNDGTYIYIDSGSALGSQRPFYKGRAPLGRCVTLKRRRWYPKSCTRRLFFICEKPDNLQP